MLTVVQLAEASVEKERPTTSDKRKRRLNKMDPPKTNAGFDYSRSRQTFQLGGTLVRNATAMPIGAQSQARCSKHLQIEEIVK
jgi:hypothetical protein